MKKNFSRKLLALHSATALVLAICTFMLSAYAQSAQPVVTRGAWIAGPGHGDFFNSRQHIERHLAELAAAGINSVFVVMWNQGRTFYPSTVLEKLTGIDIDERLGGSGRDPLQEIIDAAKPHRLRVFAWFEFGFAADLNGGRGQEILQRKPQWLARDRHGQPLVKNGFRWMNALDPDVQDFMISLMMEVVERYDVAGIQGDDRLPAFPAEGGHDASTLARYRQQHEGRDPPASVSDPAWSAWVQWRADHLNRFMHRLHAETKRRKPAMLLAMSPSIFPWSREQYLQDWPTWVENGWVDMISPQIYRRDFAAYQTELHKISRSQVSARHRSKIVPGVLLNLGRDYRASESLVTEMVNVNRREGTGGEIYFFSEGVRQQPEFFRQLYAR